MILKKVLILFVFINLHNLYGETGEDISISWGGAGWLQTQVVGQSSDTGQINPNGNIFLQGGGQLTALAKISERWEGAAGVGVIRYNPAFEQSKNILTNQERFKLDPYITEGRFTFHGFGTPESPKVSITGGIFSYNYNPDAHNMGMYLIRGPVYPGFLYSGFETIEVLPIGNKTGFLIESKGVDYFKWDNLLTTETEFKPFFDLSFTSIMNYSFGDILKIGAGVEFHRAIEFNKCATSPKNMDELTNCANLEPLGEFDLPNETGLLDSMDLTGTAQTYKAPLLPSHRKYIYVDSINNDTTLYSLSGTKLMFMVSLDLKPLLFENYIGNQNDLKFYFESALLGIKDYKYFYEDKAQRIPIMFGFNIPTFGFLDALSMEFEYYNSPFKNDSYKLEEDLSPIPPAPTNRKRDKSRTVYDSAADNLKWSLYISKIFYGHIKFSGQLASDHWHIGGTKNKPTYEEGFTQPDDWYWALKLAYFF